jgi:hypothetical protein
VTTGTVAEMKSRILFILEQGLEINEYLRLSEKHQKWTPSFCNLPSSNRSSSQNASSSSNFSSSQNTSSSSNLPFSPLADSGDLFPLFENSPSFQNASS